MTQLPDPGGSADGGAPASRLLEIMVRVAGTVVAIWGAVLLALFGAFITPLRVGTVLAPVAIGLAIAGNALIVWFAHRVTRSRLLGVLPGLVWLVLTFFAVDRTTEGDLVLYQSNWVAVGYLLAGSATIAIATTRLR